MTSLLSTMMNMPQSISSAEIDRLSKTKQIFSDCYLVSTLNSLCRTEKGQDILKNNIKKVDANSSYKEDGYVIHYQNINNTQRDVFVSQKEIDSLNVERAKKLRHCMDTEENNTLKAIEVSMKKLITEDPTLKNFISRLTPCLEKFENNLPSNFIKMFANKDTTNLNLKTPFLNMRFCKNKAKELLKQIESAGKNQHFIACTSYFNGPFFKNWHCYAITDVDTKKNTVMLYEPRSAKEMCVDIDYFLKKFKFISGYFE